MAFSKNGTDSAYYFIVREFGRYTGVRIMVDDTHDWLVGYKKLKDKRSCNRIIVKRIIRNCTSQELSWLVL